MDNTSQKFHARQLKTMGFLRCIQRKLHTKHWFALSSSMQHLFGTPIMILRLDRLRSCQVDMQAMKKHNLSLAICWTNLSSLEARREPSSLACFYKIHSGTVCLEKVTYLIPAPNLSRKQGHLTTHSTLYIFPIVMP